MIDGYFLLSRKMFDSAIWRDDPHILKLFIYLIGKARHHKTPKKYPLFEVSRGELVTSLSIISDENEYIYRSGIRKWSRSKTSRMLKILEEQSYIKILADTYGTHIKICNYDTYQVSENYKRTEVKQFCNSSATVVDIYNNDKNDNNDKNINIQIENFIKKIKAYIIENPKYKPVEKDFLNYWTESSKSGKSFRYKDQKYFDIGKRLGTFLSGYKKKQRFNLPEDSQRKPYKDLSKFKDFGDFIDYYTPYHNKATDSLLPYSKKVKDLAYSFIMGNIRLDEAIKKFEEVR